MQSSANGKNYETTTKNIWEQSLHIYNIYILALGEGESKGSIES